MVTGVYYSYQDDQFIMCINVRSLCDAHEANMIVNGNYTAFKEKEKIHLKFFCKECPKR